MKKNKGQRRMRARRDIVPEAPKNKKKKILLVVAISLAVLLIGAAIAVLVMSPTIDTDKNPFNANVLTSFGRAEAYNYSNSHRMYRPHTMGVIYTLEDFFGRGLLVGETHPDDIIRNKNAYNILVVGKDRVGSNTDVIMVVNFNAKTQKINVLQIPRDTYVEDPINRNSSKRVNAVYAFAYVQNKRKYSSHDEASHASLRYLETTIEDTFGITIDNYFMIDLNGFVKIIDSIGGVEVDVPFNMYYNDDEQNLHINLKKGLQTLNGNQSEQFVRFRNTYVLGDLGRVSAQKIFLAALVDKLLSPEWYSLDSLTSVASNLIKYSTTGMTLSDLVGYLKKIDFGRLSSDSITFYTAQGEGYFTSGGASLYSLYLEENLEIINKAFNLYNKDITADNVTLSEQYRSPYVKGNTEGDTAEDIGKEPPKIIVAGGGSSRPKPVTPPTTDEPVTDEPVTDKPVTDEPVTDEPVTDEPVTDEPVTDEPVTDEPVIDEPVTDEPVTDEPTTDEPVIDEPTEPEELVPEEATPDDEWLWGEPSTITPNQLT